MTPDESQAAAEARRLEWITDRAYQWWVWRSSGENPGAGDELSDWLNAEREYDQMQQSTS